MIRKFKESANNLCMLFATLKFMEAVPEYAVDVAARNSSKLDVTVNPQSEPRTPGQNSSEIFVEGNPMLRENENEFCARTPTPRNPTAAGGNSGMTLRDVSDGLKIWFRLRHVSS